MTHHASTHQAIWNRACARDWEPKLDGDIFLSRLLSFHGEAMNGGVLSALEMQRQSIDDAAHAYRYFGLEATAALLLKGAAAYDQHNSVGIDELEEELDEDYHVDIPRDAVLYDAFLNKIKEKPEDFSPLN